MNDKRDEVPDSTAARAALWRALHVEVDAAPHVLEDKVGLKLLSPDANWRERGDMDPPVHAALSRLHRGACPLHR